MSIEIRGRHSFALSSGLLVINTENRLNLTFSNSEISGKCSDKKIIARNCRDRGILKKVPAIMRKLTLFAFFSLLCLELRDSSLSNTFSDQAQQVSIFVRHQNHVNEDDAFPEGRRPPDEAQPRLPDA
jgi:hypothetical protein